MNFPKNLIKSPNMVVGADVTHPGAKQARHDIPFSIAAVTATVSYNLMKYVAAIRRQRLNDKTKNGSQEIIEEMKDMFCDLLKVSKANRKWDVMFVNATAK